MCLSKLLVEYNVGGSAMAKELSLMVECEGCHSKFTLVSDNVTYRRKFDICGRSIFLTYYDCQSCGRRHFVQIDDNQTLEIMKVNKRTFTKLAAKRANNRDIPQKQLDKYKKQTKHLRNRRMELMKEFTGIMLHDDETDNDFELRFSV